MPVGELAEDFRRELGAPTKELYSMAGLVFLADFLSWTAQEAVEAYIFRSDLQHTLNLEPVGSSGDTILHSEKLSMVSLRQVSFGKEEETRTLKTFR